MKSLVSRLSIKDAEYRLGISISRYLLKLNNAFTNSFVFYVYHGLVNQYLNLHKSSMSLTCLYF